MPYNTPRPAPRNGPGTCPRCHAEVIFCLNANGNTQAINPNRVEEWGNQAVRKDVAGRWHVRQLGGDRKTLEGSEALHYPHAPTCTQPAPKPPAQHRSPAKARVGIRPVRRRR